MLGSTRRVLVVGDSAAIRRYAGSILEDRGVRPTEADTYLGASELLKEAEFDLIFADLDPPEAESLHTVATLLLGGRARKAPPIILCSEQADETREMGRSLSLARVSFLTKPFGPRDLRQAAEELLCD